ncbi:MULTISPECIES: amidohydrolase family protein [Pseudonocardia]|uniref:N-substituted formamide deformylase n=2 Tax=Pseudonocardia TaxID=1847 RepID=A0A1Y2MPJ8_PSEAH|nr:MULTISPECIES: amidohydrolase family protein [Pseudonocardia]OSY37071.1 N-substituted formamide deformylase precursor [Pseudonocardia autotrophica]TDN72044.1 putative amidohydrolase YtcJ [Pseudonocardia autotrophica]BBG02739.1 amidohydrolase [Pseudonocardia autotrophica]GEC25928.1 amidohydrolase [Pseudonocardia saturnea]
MTLLLRRVEVRGALADVTVRDGRIHAVDPAGAVPAGVSEVLDGRGGALLPGLADHHLHLHALAAARESVPAGRDRSSLLTALAAARPGTGGWIRVVGNHDDDLDARVLDTVRPADPVRVQHHSGAMWTLNSAALAVLGDADHPGLERDAAGAPTGRLFRADAWLRAHLPGTGPPDPRGVATELAGYGITAVTDATPDLAAAAVASLSTVRQRLTLLGLPLGADPPPGVAAGPYKIVLSDHDLPGPDELADRIAAAHRAGRGVAVHSVTVESLVLLLAALEVAGRHPGDRVEHAALVPEALLPELRGLTVVTQPGFLRDRGDRFRREVPAVEHPDLYRCASIDAAGVGLGLSSDAPYGPADPWTVVAAAVSRTTPDGEPLGPAERLGARRALAGYLSPAHAPGGPARRLAPGAPADLVLLHAPLDTVLSAPDASAVRAVFLAGERLVP